MQVLRDTAVSKEKWHSEITTTMASSERNHDAHPPLLLKCFQDTLDNDNHFLSSAKCFLWTGLDWPGTVDLAC